jgi:hypothetical protein
MKILKILNSLGYYIKSDGSYGKVDEITKDDILRLIELTLNSEVEFDDYDDKLLPNQAHQIVYKSILSKLRDLSIQKREFTDEVDKLFVAEFEKYKP